MDIHNFLSNRQQYVAVNRTTSSEAQVRSGIPQGSVLEPLLFLILISDINYEIADSTVSCFADDTWIILGIKDEEDTQMLQNDLHKLYISLNYWERLRELKLYSLQRPRERYIIIYIWKITQHMVPNIDGTIGHKIKTRKHPRHGTQYVIQ